MDVPTAESVWMLGSRWEMNAGPLGGWQGVVEVRYFGSTIDRVGVSWTNADGTDRSQVSPAAYTPWLIGSNVIAWPSLEVNGGGMSTFFGEVEVKLLGPADGPDGTTLPPSQSGILYASLPYDRAPVPPACSPVQPNLARIQPAGSTMTRIANL